MSSDPNGALGKKHQFFEGVIKLDVHNPRMALRHEGITKSSGLEVLRYCYKFVAHDWQHLPREALPDQGFEMLLRQSCSIALNGWQVAQEWELGFGDGLGTASGVRHEIDFIARHPDAWAIAELKNKPGCPPGKNDVIIFFAKIIDYLAHNPRVLLKEVVPIFVSSSVLEEATLAACLGLGIHPVTPGLRPIPLLADSLERVEFEMARGLILPQQAVELWDNACAGLNRLSLGLDETWMSTRCGYMSDELINLRATLDVESYELSRELRRANADCSAILEVVKSMRAIS